MAHGAKTRSPQRAPARNCALALEIVPDPVDELDRGETVEALDTDAPVAALDATPDDETGEEEAAVEAEVASEEELPADEASEQDAVVEILLRRSGVLPRDLDLGDRDEENTLPPPRRSDEFVCSGCFLIKARTQLGDADRSLCRDCADDAPRPAPVPLRHLKPVARHRPTRPPVTADRLRAGGRPHRRPA